MSKTFKYAYIRKKFVTADKAVIPIQAKVVQYGLGVFSGIRGHWNEEHKNLYLYRVKDHYNRMKESALITGMAFKYTFPQYEKIIFDLINKNRVKEDLYIRPTLYASSTKLTPRFDNDDDDLAVYMISLKDYFSGASGLKTCVSSWRRFDDDMLSTKAKITGAYANSALAKTDAVLNGYDEPIFLNRDGKVCEASGANLFGIKENVMYTPPLHANNLHGITRRSVIEIARNELGLEVREEEFDRSTLYTFDELCFTGTAAKISWIASVDLRKIGNGKIGKNTKKLKEIFEKIVVNEMPQYSHWLTPVY